MFSHIGMAKAKITFLALLLIFPAVIHGVNIYVGDMSTGWNDYTDYQDWAEDKTFTTKDLLVFQYSSRHSVAEVNETGFNYCDSSNPIYLNDTSPTSFPLTTPGTRYFICPTFGHCAGGMKLAVTVTDASGTGTPPPSETTPPPPPRTTRPGSSPPSGTTTPSPPQGTTRSPPEAGTTQSPPAPSGAAVVSAGWNSLFVGVLIVVATLFGISSARE